MKFVFKKIKNKKLTLFFAIIVAIILLAGAAFILRSRFSGMGAQSGQQLSASAGKTLAPPDFLTIAEKEKLGVSPNLKIQSLKRNADGQVMVYKIIKSNGDIVADPSKIAPILPPVPASANK